MERETDAEKYQSFRVAGEMFLFYGYDFENSDGSDIQTTGH